MRKETIYCDKCRSDITLEPFQSICLGRSQSYDLCLKCYDSLDDKWTDIKNEILANPNRCYDWKGEKNE